MVLIIALVLGLAVVALQLSSTPFSRFEGGAGPPRLAGQQARVWRAGRGSSRACSCPNDRGRERWGSWCARRPSDARSAGAAVSWSGPAVAHFDLLGGQLGNFALQMWSFGTRDRNALVALPYGLSHAAGLQADDAVLVTEPMTKIHSTISISSWSPTARPGR